MSALRDLVTIFRRGAGLHGWYCPTCRRMYVHDGMPRRTFARFALHKVARHHERPRPHGQVNVHIDETAARIARGDA